MTFELAALPAIAAVAGFGLAFATFWMTFGSKISEAKLEAMEAKVSARDANDKIAIQTAAFALYREQIAREYITREVMREFEDRLTQAIDRLADRLDRVLERAESHKT